MFAPGGVLLRIIRISISIRILFRLIPAVLARVWAWWAGLKPILFDQVQPGFAHPYNSFLYILLTK